MFSIMLSTAGIAAVLGLALSRAVIGLGVKDGPTEARKTQVTPVPTSGGLGFGLAAMLAVLIVSEVLPGGFSIAGVWVVGVGATAALLLGFADDARPLPASVKLLLILAISATMAAVGVRADVLTPWLGATLHLPYMVALVGSVAWLVVVINAVNFMDGANGLSMGMALIGALGLGALGLLCGRVDIAATSFALASALGGFLVWNVPGKLFAGDAGALFAGASLGGLSLLLVRERPDFLFAPPLVLMPYLSDVLLTLAWRWKHGKKLFAAHRDHAYQIALKAGLSHVQVSGIHAVWALNAAAIGVAAATAGPRVLALAFVALLGASVWVHTRVRRSGERAGLVGADQP